MNFETIKVEQSVKEIRRDLNYLDKNITFYLIDENILVNEVTPALQKGVMSLEQFLVWSIWDMIMFVLYDSGANSKDTQFVAYDKTIKEIINKYNLDVEIE